jgi:hypothetical protein
MGKKRLPELPETGRHYLDNTLRARLQSPGIEKYAPRRGKAGPIALAVAIAAALVAAMLLLR